MFNLKRIGDIAAAALHENVDSVRTFYAGGMNYVFELGLSGKTLMFKAYPLTRINAAQREFKILTAAINQGMQVPEPITFGIEPELGYLIYPSIKGNDLDFDQTIHKELICRDLIRNLRALANIRFDCFGSVLEKEQEFSSWPAFLQHSVTTGIEALRDNEQFSSQMLNDLSKFMLSHPLLDKVFDSLLVWGDLKSENILIDNNTLTALIDFETCFSGDPLLSLGYLYAREGESLFYRCLAADFQQFISFEKTDIYFYACLRLLRIGKYLNRPLPTGKLREPIFNYFPGIEIALNFINKS